METPASSLAPARIPSLDGWRGVAIALVLFDHLQYTILGTHLWPWAETGQHGVTIFFVLSGFLITTTLVKNSFDFKRFYIRRFFRLMPVAWFYLVFLAALDGIFQARLFSLKEISSCVFSTATIFASAARARLCTSGRSRSRSSSISLGPRSFGYWA
jgi:peptidoglycan/LPS O-acetylase OafA/YrhL